MIQAKLGLVRQFWCVKKPLRHETLRGTRNIRHGGNCYKPYSAEKLVTVLLLLFFVGHEFVDSNGKFNLIISR